MIENLSCSSEKNEGEDLKFQSSAEKSLKYNYSENVKYLNIKFH